MENVENAPQKQEGSGKKNKRARSLVFLAIIIGLVIAGAAVWVLYYQNRTYPSDAVGHVDGTVETGTNRLDKLVKAAPDAKPASIAAGKSGDTKRISLVLTGFTGDDDQDAKILEHLKEKNVKATFALSASEALENRDGLKDVVKSGAELVSNGAAGETGLESKSARAQVKSLYKSRTSLATASGKDVDLVYCSGTKLTGNVLRAAGVSGYKAAISADDANVLGKDSFKEAGDAQTFVSGLSGDTVVVFNLRGAAETPQAESAIVAEKPAVNKQADLEDDTAEDEEETDIAEQLGWLIDAIAASGDTTIHASELETTDGTYALKSEALATDAGVVPVYRSCLTSESEVGVGVRNLPDKNDVSVACDLLREHKLSATWFVTRDQLASKSTTLDKLVKAGATFGLDATGDDFAGLDAGAVFDKLYAWQKDAGTHKGYTDLVLVDSKCDADELAALRTAANALKLKIVDPASPKKAQAGSLYMVDELSLEDFGRVSDAAEKADLKVVGLDRAIKDSGTIPVLNASQLSSLRKKNDGKKTKLRRMVYTSDRMTSFVFYGVSNAAATRDTAARMNAHNAHGTYFCTLDELMNCPATIEYLLSQGDEIGIYYRVTDEYPATFDAVASYINAWRKYATWRYGTTSSVVFSLNDLKAEGVREGVSAMGCKLIKNTYLVVRDEDRDITVDQASQALDEISSMRVTRGSFVCFNLDFYANDQNVATGSKTVVGAVLDGFFTRHIDTLAYTNHDGVIEDGSRFTVTTASAVLSSKHRYTPNRGKGKAVSLNKNVLTNMKSDTDRFHYMQQRYLGNVTVDVSQKLPGFSDDEVAALDKNGTFTNDKVLFLTFDDWGTEQSINELLYVLKKHDVKGTFFVKTEYVPSNPNSLRAIAMDGHQIADHTCRHIPLANEDASNENLYHSLSEDEASAMRKDLAGSYQTLYKYTSDVTVDGKKALSTMFRPPTLAVSKIGLYQVFDVGYTYSISGGYSTGDYEASSYDDMMERLDKRSIGGDKYIKPTNGTVIVMHMQENAKYTAQALDTMIPVWKARGYRFARIDDYLGK